MTRNRLIIGAAMLVLLVASAGCAADLEQPPEAANTLERAVEETIAVSDQPAGEPDIGLAPPAEGATTFSITGYVTVDAYHYDAATGTYVHFYHDEGSNVITQIGYDFIAKQISGTSTSTPAIYISLSLDTATPLLTWTELSNSADDASTEISTNNGLDRIDGTYAHTGLADTWTITKEFTAGATFNNVQMTGLQWDATELLDNTLLAANTFTPVTLNNGDTLTITWTLDLVP